MCDLKKKHLCDCTGVFVCFGLVVHQVELFQQIENQADDYCGHCSQSHAGQADGAEVQSQTGQTCYENNRGGNQILVLAVVHLLVYQNAQTGGANHAVQQESDAANYVTGDGGDERGQGTDECHQNGEDCCACDNLHGIYAGNSHNTDVFTVGGGGNTAQQTGQSSPF